MVLQRDLRGTAPTLRARSQPCRHPPPLPPHRRWPREWKSAPAQWRPRCTPSRATAAARVLKGSPPEKIPNLNFGINAALSSALAAVLTGGMSLNESLDRVEWVARTLLTAA